jgi:hypothetical protein
MGLTLIGAVNEPQKMDDFPVFDLITGNIREETGSRQTASTANVS